MTPINKKINVGMTLLTLFLITLATGIILHLKKHGIVIEPRPVIKYIHWISGFLMAGFTCWHGSQFWKMFVAFKQRFRWFWLDTIGVIAFTAATVLTGAVKLLSPVKIPHLGLWHYYLGLIMSALIIFHLVKGLPTLSKMMKAGKK